MSALPTAAFFRRFALPVHFATAANGDAGHQPPSGTRTAVRPRLVASWSTDAGGHSVCRWTILDRVPSAPG